MTFQSRCSLINKNSTNIELDKLYTNICFNYKTVFGLFLNIGINSFGFYSAMKEQTDCKLVHEALGEMQNTCCTSTLRIRPERIFEFRFHDRFRL